MRTIFSSICFAFMLVAANAETDTGCTSFECGYSCSGDGCAAKCTSIECGDSCSGDGCAAKCTGDYCGYLCSGANCACECKGENCGQDCKGENCGPNATCPSTLITCIEPTADASLVFGGAPLTMNGFAATVECAAGYENTADDLATDACATNGAAYTVNGTCTLITCIEPTADASLVFGGAPLTMNGFAATVGCAAGYENTADDLATVACATNGAAYTVTGTCTKVIVTRKQVTDCEKDFKKARNAHRDLRKAILTALKGK